MHRIDMVERLETLADVTIRRACGFAGLAIGSTMLALSFDLGLAFRTGGVLTACLLVGLLAKAWGALRQPPRRTEVWMILVSEGGPPEPRTAARIGPVLRARYLWHADRAAALALGLWLLGHLASALGTKG